MALNPGIIELPETGYWVMEADSCLTPKAAANHGDIIIEWYIRDLPAVRRLKPGSVFLDVGAFVGDVTLIALDLGCETWAFEAYPDAFECLSHNCPSAHCVNRAVGDGRPAHVEGVFGRPNGSNFGTRMVSPGGEPSLRLDEMDWRRVDFIKIDVEGFEPAVLDGAAETIKRFKPSMLVEVYDDMLRQQGFSEEELLARIEGMGYALTKIGDRGTGKYDVLAVGK